MILETSFNIFREPKGIKVVSYCNNLNAKRLTNCTACACKIQQSQYTLMCTPLLHGIHEESF